MVPPPHRRFLCLLFLLSMLLAGDSDRISDRKALMALRAAVGGTTSLWNPAEGGDHCQFSGVSCGRGDGRVTALRLPASALSGQIPEGTVGNLTALRSLSLRYNDLRGALPHDLSRCADLTSLNLQGNRFSGEVPAALFSIRPLARLDLSRNNFSGPISVGFNNFTRMKTLFLENNAFTGSIPELKLENLEQFNVSLNRLNGLIPSTMGSFPANSFTGNSLCGKPLNPCSHNEPSPAPAMLKNGKKLLSGEAIAGIVIGSVMGFLLIALFLYFLRRRKRAGASPMKALGGETEIPGEKQIVETQTGGPVTRGISPNGLNKKLVFFGNSPRTFDLEDLLRASAEVLGKGSFGTAYKAAMEMGTAMVVKRLRDATGGSEIELREKIEEVGSMKHENLVALRAYYFSADEKLLVFDYMPMGSLFSLLHGAKGAGRTPLNWEIRSDIALGAARGIAYLHARGPATSHGSIRSTNILLTESYGPCVSDFGLTNLMGPPSSPAGVDGYRAPEVTDPRKISQRADVFSFGVLLLEILTGKAPPHALLSDGGVDLPKWIQSIAREKWGSEVFDAELVIDQNLAEMARFLELGMECTHMHYDKRPSMSDVVRWIEEIRRSRSSDSREE